MPNRIGEQAIQYAGIEYLRKTNTVSPRSQIELRFSAEKMPIGIASRKARINERPVSSSVFGRRAAIFFETGWPSLHESLEVESRDALQPRKYRFETGWSKW